MAGSASPLVNSPVNGADWQYATFGPYAAANNAAFQLPFFAVEPIHIASVSFVCSTVSSALAAQLSVRVKPSGTALATAAVAVDKIVATRVLTTAGGAVAETQTEVAANTSFNRLDPGDALCVLPCLGADLTTASAPTSLAGAYITVKYQNVRAATRGNA